MSENRYAADPASMSDDRLRDQYEMLADLRDPNDPQWLGLDIAERMMDLYREGQSRSLSPQRWG